MVTLLLQGGNVTFVCGRAKSEKKTKKVADFQIVARGKQAHQQIYPSMRSLTENYRLIIIESENMISKKNLK